ncbi:MAG: hypothetical protein ABIO55_03090 [Ginsengibacter sp.]
MRKLIPALFVLLFCSNAGFAQAYESSAEYGKKKQAAFAIDYNYSEEAVENAIIKKMDKLGYNGKDEKGLFNKDKGFRVYKNASIPEISSQSMDYIVKVDQKSRRENDKSIVYLVILKDGENAMSGFGAYDIDHVKSFLNNLLPDVEAANLELQIQAQEDVIVKANKKLKNLQSDREDMENKIKKLQNDIEKNLKDQDDAEKDIENQKKTLEDIKGRRKSS